VKLKGDVMIRVLLADDHAIMRDGLKEILATVDGFELLGEAANGNEVLDALHHMQPDLLMMDMSMPGVSGVSLIEKVKNLYPKLPVLVLTMLDDVQIALRALKSGADGYITKDRPAAELVAALRKVAAGGRYVDPRLAEEMVFNDAGADLPHNKLSSREMDVFKMLVQGKNHNEIADQLFISNKTVSTHKAHLLEKMGMKNMSELVRYAVLQNLFS
jgi:DNA-binding NarL/FixJ family response regulator